MGAFCSCGDSADPPNVSAGAGYKKPENQPLMQNDQQTGGNPLDNMVDLYPELARFVRTLPDNSKKRIWSHVKKEVKKRENEKAKKNEALSNDEKQLLTVEFILCDCLIVFIKWLDQNQPQLQKDEVLGRVQPCAQYIVSCSDGDVKFDKDKFVSEANYLPKFLEDFHEHQGP